VPPDLGRCGEQPDDHGAPFFVRPRFRGGPMSRQLPAPLQNEIEAPELRPFFAVSIALPDEANAWSGIGEIELDGKTFTGVGSLAGISVVSEKADGSAGGIT